MSPRPNEIIDNQRYSEYSTTQQAADSWNTTTTRQPEEETLRVWSNSLKRRVLGPRPQPKERVASNLSTSTIQPQPSLGRSVSASNLVTSPAVRRPLKRTSSQVLDTTGPAPPSKTRRIQPNTDSSDYLTELGGITDFQPPMAVGLGPPPTLSRPNDEMLAFGDVDYFHCADYNPGIATDYGFGSVTSSTLLGNGENGHTSGNFGAHEVSAFGQNTSYVSQPTGKQCIHCLMAGRGELKASANPMGWPNPQKIHSGSSNRAALSPRDVHLNVSGSSSLSLEHSPLSYVSPSSVHATIDDGFFPSAQQFALNDLDAPSCNPLSSRAVVDYSLESSTTAAFDFASPATISKNLKDSGTQSSRPLAPKPSTDVGDRRSQTARVSPASHMPSTPKTAIPPNKTPYTRAPLQKKYCNLCSEHKNGFRGEHELRRHMERAHSTTRKMWKCVNANPDPNFLANCKACVSGKLYGVYYNAAAHLRRAHFHPRKRGRGRGKPNERRGGKGGGDDPPMEELKKYMIEVEQVCPENGSPSSNSEEEPDLDGTNDSRSSIPEDFDPSFFNDDEFSNHQQEHQSSSFNGNGTSKSNKAIDFVSMQNDTCMAWQANEPIECNFNLFDAMADIDDTHQPCELPSAAQLYSLPHHLDETCYYFPTQPFEQQCF